MVSFLKDLSSEIPPKKQNIPVRMILDESWKDCLIRKASDRDTENSHGKGSRWEWFLRCRGLDNCVSSKTL